MFTEQDTACIRAHGLTPEAVERQLENFRRGFPFLKKAVRSSVVSNSTSRAARCRTWTLLRPERSMS